MPERESKNGRDPRTPPAEGRTYAASGVDQRAADELVDQIAPLAAATCDDRVLAGVGPFAGLMRPLSRDGRPFRDPVLAASCDGVGTKLLLARRLKEYRGLGRDLVAMNVNDVLTTGAEPLFFLDYVAASRLEPEIIREVIAGASEALDEIACPLIGGETAQMPGLYRKGDFDLAGFAVGVVEADRILGPARVRAGDQLLGIPSVGPHANGFSLVRELVKDLSDAELRRLREDVDSSLAESLLVPTPVYAEPIRALLERFGPEGLHAAAHITGGGVAGNLVRVMPRGCRAAIAPGCWPVPWVFDWISGRGKVEKEEMRATFNMGLGMVLVMGRDSVDDALETLAHAGMPGRWVGEVESVEGPGEVEWA